MSGEKNLRARFLAVEEAFVELKHQLLKKEISPQAFIARMKALRIRDEEGRLWMIGMRSGKWYRFDGGEWVMSDPPFFQDKENICYSCGFLNPWGEKICQSCGESLVLEEDFSRFPSPSKEENLPPPPSKSFSRGKWIFQGLSPLSFLFFLGTAGLILGGLVGAFVGATGTFSQAVGMLPSFFQEIQGKLVGSLIFALLGGLSGFIVLGVLGLIIALFINLIIFLMGGVKISLGERKDEIE